jgi:hypothetical protein
MPRKQKIADPFDELPRRVQRVIKACRGGARLTKSLRLKEAGETEVTFVFEPSGRRAPVKSSQEAIASGFLVPMGDGLFDPSLSQTWRAK